MRILFLISLRLFVNEVAGVKLEMQFSSPVHRSHKNDDVAEPYSSEKMSRVPGGYKALSQPFQALTVDFNSLQVIAPDDYSIFFLKEIWDRGLQLIRHCVPFV